MDELLKYATHLADQTSHALSLPIKGRVAYVVSHGQSYASNGYAIRTQGVAKALNQHGLETLCFVRPGRPWELKQNTQPVLPEVTIQGVRYIHSRWPDDVAPTHERVHLEASVQHFMTLFSVYRPEVVLAASNWIVGLPAWVAAKRLGLPFYNEVRGFWELSKAAHDPAYEGSKTSQIDAERDTFVAKQGRATFTLNAPMQDELIKRGVKRESIKLVPNGVSQLPKVVPANPALKKQLGIKEGEHVVGYVGSFSPYEGLDVLFEACTELVQKGEKLKLLLVGDSQPLTLRNKSGASAAHIADTGFNKIPPWLIQVGRVPHEQVADYYALLDAVVIPRKPLAVCQLVPPMKAAEALAYGKRLVVSDVAPLAEYADHFEGVLSFEAGSAASLAAALQRSLKLPAPKPTAELLFAKHTEPMVKVLRGEGSAAGQNASQPSVLKNHSPLVKESASITKRSDAYVPAESSIKATLLVDSSEDKNGLLSLKEKSFTVTIDSWIDDAEDLDVELFCRVNDEALIEKNAGIVKVSFLDEKGKAIEKPGLNNLSWSEYLGCWYFYFKPEKANAESRSAFSFIKPKGVSKIEVTFSKWHVADVGLKNSITITKRPSIQHFLRSDFSKIIGEIEKPVIKSAVKKSKGKLCYILNHSLPYQSEGYATRAHGLAKAIGATGAEVVCISRPGFPWSFIKEYKDQTLPGKETIEGVEYQRLREPKGWKGTHNYIAKAAHELEKKLIEIKPSCVMAASDFKNAMPAYLAARRLGIPFIYEIRGFWEVTHESRDPSAVQTSNYHLTRHLETLLARHSDHVFTLTKAMQQALVDRGLPSEQISLLPNSCDPATFDPKNNPKNKPLLRQLNIPDDVPVIGYIGTFNAYEGLDDLMHACGKLYREGVVFRTLLVGSEPSNRVGKGPCASEIESIAASYGFKDWLIMPGRIPHDQVSDYYSLIDIAPFTRKPLPVTELVSPLKPLEAMAMEKALVVSSVGALAEMVQDGKTGLVYEKGNIDSLAGKLASLLTDASIRQQMGKHARQWVIGNRTWKICAERVREKAHYFEENPPVVTIPPKKQLPSKLASQYKVAFIADEFSYNSFKDEFQAIVIEPSNWKQLFAEHKPDIFFCESAWSGVDSKRRPWQGKVYTSINWKNENRTVLLSILDHCRQEGIPTVFWNKEDPTHFTDRVHDFIATAKEFDYVFTTAEECCELYRQEYGVKNVFALPFATNPRLFNPIAAKPRTNKVVFAGSWYANHEERSAVMKRIMDALLESGYELEVYDRYHGSGDPLHEWPEKYKKFIRPGLPHQQMPDVYRSSQLGLNFNTVTNSATMFARRVFELMSSNTLVISNYSKGVDKMFGDLVVFADRDAGRLKSLSSQEIEELKERSLQLVLEKHTYTNRWQEILTKIGAPWRQDNKGLTFVCRVASDEDASRAIDHYQNHYASNDDNQLLLLVAESVDPLQVREFYKKYNRVGITVTCMHHIKHYALSGRYQPIETKYFVYGTAEQLPSSAWIKKASSHLAYAINIPLTPQQGSAYSLGSVSNSDVFLGHATDFLAIMKEINSGSAKAFQV
ncbi:glycosyltransferase [Vreelandella piezotolerans]|uniref:Glycosyltransferase n=1 Tax=Vreelandella piezotolerans TaxID=2609667 RepID=A0ABQ6XAH3_9GAMM|nr:glycosyltransferase [Halomonas piezotolerans]KAE8439014.1 glycosyltransferase [Halomonas piezotolerans]QJA24662.1 glycosyltransferase [Halomonas piezotolerans]